MAQTKLNPDLTATIGKLIEHGNYANVAAQYCGISRTTFYSWLGRGAKAKKRLDEGEEVPVDENIYIVFLDTIEQARAKSEVYDNQVITKAAAGGSWKAALERLQRKYPLRWGRRAMVTLEQIPGSDDPTSDAELLTKQHLDAVAQGAYAALFDTPELPNVAALARMSGSGDDAPPSADQHEDDSYLRERLEHQQGDEDDSPIIVDID